MYYIYVNMLTFCRLGYTKVWNGNPRIFEEGHGDMLVYGEISLLADRHAGWRQHLADLRIARKLDWFGQHSKLLNSF